MNIRAIRQVQEVLSWFVSNFVTILGRCERRHCCLQYLNGLLLDGERKSIQPMSLRLPEGNDQSLQQFVSQSPWDHQQILSRLRNLMIKEFRLSKGVLILDDTSLPKKGKHSVGVARQYCGALGKVANCQSLVTLQYSSKDLHFPLEAELYLPESWIQYHDKMVKLGVPSERFHFKRKWEIALDLLQRVKKECSYHILMMDAGYGEIREFLRVLDDQKEPFIAQIPESHTFWPVDVPLITSISSRGRPRVYPEVASHTLKPLSAKSWSQLLIQQKSLQVQLPLKKIKTVKAWAVRVKDVFAQAYYRPGEERWFMVIQTAEGEMKYYVSNLPASTSLKQMVLWASERWKIEQGYQQLKEELGLDHYEGRSWRGLHHHVTLCFMAYCFLKLLHSKIFKKKPSYFASSEALA